MSDLPEQLLYSDSHEWLRREDDGTITVGITDYAQRQLGDLVYVEAPEIGQVVAVGDACAVVESVKSASDVFSPVAGEIIDANADLVDQPELVNNAPYEGGWLFRIRLSGELPVLLDADSYRRQIERAG